MLQIIKSAAIKVTVAILFPEENPVVRGTVKCEYVYHTQAQLNQIRDDFEDKKISAEEMFRKYVKSVDGIPGEDGQPLVGDAAFEWLETHEYGVIIRAAILKDYNSWVSEGRAKNSNRSRG
jgi:hypothetical protein